MILWGYHGKDPVLLYCHSMKKVGNKKKNCENARDIFRETTNLEESYLLLLLNFHWQHEEESLKTFSKAIYNHSNQSSAAAAWQQTVRKLCQLHPNVHGTSESPKNYILNLPARNSRPNLADIEALWGVAVSIISHFKGRCQCFTTWHLIFVVWATVHIIIYC